MTINNIYKIWRILIILAIAIVAPLLISLPIWVFAHVAIHPIIEWSLTALIAIVLFRVTE